MLSSVSLPSDKHFAVLKSECLHKVLPESNELLAELNFVLDVRRALSEANPYRLLHVDDICEISSCIRV